MYRRGPFWGGGYMRRRGFPLFPMGMYGMGMGMGGGGLIGDLIAGGIGYMMGRQSAQQAPQYQPPQYQNPQYQPQQVPQYQPPQAPQYQPPPTPQYQPPQYQPQQVPQYQPPAQYQASGAAPNQQGTAASGTNERLAQLRLLGHLRDSGLLTNDEFEVEKQKIMQGS